MTTRFAWWPTWVPAHRAYIWLEFYHQVQSWRRYSYSTWYLGAGEWEDAGHPLPIDTQL